MKTLILALGLAVSASTAALAQSSILDISKPEPVKQSAIDYTPTASIGAVNEFETRARLGDGSPQYAKTAGGSIDYTATASIGVADDGVRRDRLGDGSPQYK